ncbi:MAG: hypothetical protein V1874_07675 [Spirochaetota bacterium]
MATDLPERLKQFKNKITKQRLIAALVFIFILVSGFGIGRIIGSQIITGIFKGSRTALLFYRPPFKYIYTAKLLYSSDELLRLEGYYSLLDNNLIDTDLLIERYGKESDFIKPVIIWIFGYSSDKSDVLKFISEEYKTSDKRIKAEIIRTMKRIDEDYYIKFAKANNIK